MEWVDVTVCAVDDIWFGLKFMSVIGRIL